MSSQSATAIALLLYAAALAPLTVAVWRASFLPRVGALVAVPIVALGLVQTGIFHRNQLASTEVTNLLLLDAFASRCEQTIETLIDAEVVLGRPTSDGLVVRGAAWDQLPAQLHEPIVTCAQELAGESAPEPLPIIRR